MNNYIKSNNNEYYFTSNNWFEWNNTNACYEHQEAYIKGYINCAENVYVMLKNTNNNYIRKSLINAYLFSIRQSLELVIKSLYFMKESVFYKTDKHKQTHDISLIFNDILVDESFINFEQYGLVKNDVIEAIKFIADKDQFVKYPTNVKYEGHETYFINISSWLHLVNALFDILVDKINDEKLKKENK